MTKLITKLHFIVNITVLTITHKLVLVEIIFLLCFVNIFVTVVCYDYTSINHKNITLNKSKSHPNHIKLFTFSVA